MRKKKLSGLFWIGALVCLPILQSMAESKEIKVGTKPIQMEDKKSPIASPVHTIHLLPAKLLPSKTLQINRTELSKLPTKHPILTYTDANGVSQRAVLLTKNDTNNLTAFMKKNNAKLVTHTSLLPVVDENGKPLEEMALGDKPNVSPENEMKVELSVPVARPHASLQSSEKYSAEDVAEVAGGAILLTWYLEKFY